MSNISGSLFNYQILSNTSNHKAYINIVPLQPLMTNKILNGLCIQKTSASIISVIAIHTSIILSFTMQSVSSYQFHSIPIANPPDVFPICMQPPSHWRANKNLPHIVPCADPNHKLYQPSSKLQTEITYLHNTLFRQFPCIYCAYCSIGLYPLKAKWVDQAQDLMEYPLFKTFGKLPAIHPDGDQVAVCDSCRVPSRRQLPPEVCIEFSNITLDKHIITISDSDWEHTNWNSTSSTRSLTLFITNHLELQSRTHHCRKTHEWWPQSNISMPWRNFQLFQKSSCTCFVWWNYWSISYQWCNFHMGLAYLSPIFE